MKTTYNCLRTVAVTVVAACWVVFATGAAEPASLTVHVEGIRNSSGQILISLVGPDGQWLQPRMNPADTTGVSFDFGEVGLEKISVMAFHDENGNYQLDKKADGSPAEGCAMKECCLSAGKNSEKVLLWYNR